jgi:glycosyltransferase involved in cell wall biosynthesis
MHIAFDGTTLRPGRTGVGYYTEHLVHHLGGQCLDDDVTVISNRAVETTAPLPPAVRTEISASWMPRLAWTQSHAPRVLRRLRADVAHFTNGMVPLVSPVPTVVTIHDMSLTMYPAFHPLRRVVLNRPLVHAAAYRADAIITVSAAAKRDIVSLYGVEGSRVHVVHEAAAPAFRVIRNPSDLQRVRQRYGLAERFILYVGTIEPRKNLPKLIEAFAVRRVAGDLPHQLVCAGPYGWLSRDVEAQIDRLHVRDAVRFTGYLPFDDLPAIYNLAEMFVFPSVYEGFGLPVVEAMACGTPVITGRVAALDEVTNGAAERFAPLESDALGDCLVSLSRDRDRRAELSRLGLARARAFSWERAAAETLNIYRLAAARPLAERPAAAAVVQS